MARQLGLFAAGQPAIDESFADLRRSELAHGAWVDYVPGWVRGSDTLFDALQTTTAWRQESMHIYDSVQVVPRLLGAIPDDGPGHPLIEQMRLSLSRRYGEEFTRMSMALYRDGNDSVAFHGDTTARDRDRAVVATISLGNTRRFMLRPAEGGRSIAFDLRDGDLIVMGGTCQRTWRHGIPKVAAAGPRIAVMFRGF